MKRCFQSVTMVFWLLWKHPVFNLLFPLTKQINTVGEGALNILPSAVQYLCYFWGPMLLCWSPGVSQFTKDIYPLTCLAYLQPIYPIFSNWHIYMLKSQNFLLVVKSLRPIQSVVILSAIIKIALSEKILEVISQKTSVIVAVSKKIMVSIAAWRKA